MSMKYILDIQFFASKKGVSSTKNGRDSHSKRLGAKVADGQFATAGSITVKEVLRFILVQMLKRAAMIHYSALATVLLNMNV